MTPWSIFRTLASRKNFLHPTTEESGGFTRNGSFISVEEMVAACLSETSVSKNKTVRFHRLEDHNLSNNWSKNLNTSFFRFRMRAYAVVCTMCEFKVRNFSLCPSLLNGYRFCVLCCESADYEEECVARSGTTEKQ